MRVAMVAAASEKLYLSLVMRGSKLSVPYVAGRGPEDRGGHGEPSVQERILSVLNSGAFGTPWQSSG